MQLPGDKEELVIGVLADTHIPDRVPGLLPELLAKLQAYPIDLIFHAGDICYPPVLDRLNEIAPVIAVRGNRDFLFLGKLKLQETLEWKGLRIVLQHGHGGFLRYFIDKYYFFTQGYRFERYVPKLTSASPDADVIVFGHTHFPENVQRNGVTLFNPGSASLGVRKKYPPSFGILKLSGKKVCGEIVFMKNGGFASH